MAHHVLQFARIGMRLERVSEVQMNSPWPSSSGVRVLWRLLTEHLCDQALSGKIKRGTYLVNTARGKICDRDAVARALESGQLAGYAGDVWFPQPAPKDHPWRTMPHHGMTPHVSGTSLSAQARYAAGTREILECWLNGRPIRDEYLIVDAGALAGAGAHSYSAGNATLGSEEAVDFRIG
jgi:formate dehydrogenase